MSVPSTTIEHMSDVTELPDGPPDASGLTARQRKVLEFLRESIEKRGDRITHDTIALLHTTFITPIDRDAIHRLITRMDDILDLIQDTAEAVHLYNLRQIPPEAPRLVRLLEASCERVQAAVQLLSSMDNAAKMLAIAQEIDALESEADEAMRTGISRLFREEQDVRQLIMHKSVYEYLEEATDRCQDVANVIESVVVENV